MHCLNLGIEGHLFGSIFHTLVYDGAMPGTADARVNAIWEIIRSEYRRLKSKCRMSRLQRSLWCNVNSPHADFPFLKLKAAENKDLVPVMVTLCNMYNSGSPRDIARLGVVVQLARFYDIINNSDALFLRPRQHELAMEVVWQFSHLYNQLAMDVAANNRLLFNIVNKHHMFVHLALNTKFLNPAATWTYPYEDLMGRLKRVAMASKSGLVRHRLPGHIMTKYRQVLHFALETIQ